MRLEYEHADENKRFSPVHVLKLTPIQMPHIDIDEIKSARKEFTKGEWLTVLLRSAGMEPDKFTDREKWLLLARMIPLAENNYNLCELGPRSTGKSHIYKEISPNSILVSGGQTTVANLFYNMANRSIGLVGLWDCVAFDEVAGITFKDKDGIQIMKDYMASGSFARGKEEKASSASMVFVGNINSGVDEMLVTSHLFAPFPDTMANDTAFFDRMHCYIPGWEIPKFRPESFTDDYGFITDFLAEFMREMRKEQFGDALDEYFRLGKNLNQRDVIAARKTVSGLAKLLYPDRAYTKAEIAEILTFALEMRRRVKEQLKTIGGREFCDVEFSYIDKESGEEFFVTTPEQTGGDPPMETADIAEQSTTVSHIQPDIEQEFSRLLIEYAHVLDDKRRFAGLLKDLLPETVLETNLLLNLYDFDIHKEIEQTAQIDDAFIYRFVKRLCDEHGVNRQHATRAVTMWCSCYGKALTEKKRLV